MDGVRASGIAFLLTALVAFVPGGVRARPAADAPTYYILPLGEVDPTETDSACRSVEDTFAVRCHVMRRRPLPMAALDTRRNQYDANLLVWGLFADLPADGIGLMAITNADLFEERSARFVFGLANLVDHVGVLSLARYRDTWWGREPDPRKFKQRFFKVLIHEVGHTLGVPHCTNRRCAMRDDKTLRDLDQSPSRFCPACTEAARLGATQRSGTAAWHYMRGHSHLNRAQFVRAVYHFERAVALQPEDARFQNDLGVAYLRRGDAARALWCFRHAGTLDPTFANAHYNQGLIFLGAGDAEMARTAFEGALAADPGWSIAHRQLGYLLLEAFDDPERAVAHFEEYLDSGGDDDACVRDRVRLIKGGGLPPK